MIWKRLIIGLLLGVVGAFFLLPQFLGGSLFAKNETSALPVAGMTAEQLPVIENKPPEPERIAQGKDPEIASAAAFVMDVDSGKVLWEKNPDEPRPIASLTKLATLSVALEHDPDWEGTYVITPEENALIGAKLWVPNNEEVKIKDVFYSTLIGSANNTALALSHMYGGTEVFVEEMNALMVELGLTHTVFREPTGLSAKNVSTAREVAKLAQYAFSQEEIGEMSTHPTHDLVTLTTDWEHTVKSTNELLGTSKHTILGGKTGFTDEAGWCLVTKAEIQSFPVIVVVLGGPESESRFEETELLLDWIDDQYAWPDPITPK